jgi:hypothetical protein
MTQYGTKKGIQIYGDASVAAVMKELQQLHDREVIKPVPASTLSESEKGTLAYLMFLKEKHTEDIKGRGCADGRKQ